MSAWLVSRKHIDTLVHALGWTEIGAGPDARLSPDEIGRMLWRENMLSLQARYGDPVDEEALAAYRYRTPERRSPTYMLTVIDCYDYQTCEHSGWQSSPAHRLMMDLHDAMILGGGKRDASTAPWGEPEWPDLAADESAED